MSVDKMYVDKMSVDKTSVGQIVFIQKTGNH